VLLNKKQIKSFRNIFKTVKYAYLTRICNGKTVNIFQNKIPSKVNIKQRIEKKLLVDVVGTDVDHP